MVFGLLAGATSQDLILEQDEVGHAVVGVAASLGAEEAVANSTYVGPVPNTNIA